MATSRWLLICGVLLALDGRAEVPSAAHRPSEEIRLSLFGAPPLTGPDTTVIAAVHPGPAQSRKSPGLAAIFSLVLPGLGELYVGDFSSGKYFFAAEGLLWLTYATFDIYGNSIRDDARLFAVAHAGVNPAAKDDQYYVNVGNFLTLDQYNEKKLRDRDIGLLYPQGSGYDWQWDSDASRQSFRTQRVRSEQMFNNRTFVAAGILVNHVASAINAARAAVARNSTADNILGDLRVSGGIMGFPSAPGGVVVTLTRFF